MLCVFTCIVLSTHVCSEVYVYTRLCARVPLCLYTRACGYVHMAVSIHVPPCSCACFHVCVCVRTCARGCICARAHVCCDPVCACEHSVQGVGLCSPELCSAAPVLLTLEQLVDVGT